MDTLDKLSYYLGKSLLERDEFEELKNICPNVNYHGISKKYPHREYYTIYVGNCDYEIFVRREEV